MGTKSLPAETRQLLESMDPYARVRGALTVGTSGEAKWASFLRPLIDDTDDLVAVSAWHAASKLGMVSVDAKRALAGLASDREEVQQFAVEAFCDLKDAAVPLLESELLSEHPNSAEILEVLADIASDKSRQVLQRFAPRDRRLKDLATELLQDWD